MDKKYIIKEKKPEKPAFSIKYIDNSYDPLDNFSMYSFGKWIKNHSIPKDRFEYGAIYELVEWNNYVLSKILQHCVLNSKIILKRLLEISIFH